MRCDGRWAGHLAGGSRSLWSRTCSPRGRFGGNWRTMIVNDAEGQRWEVQPGNLSTYQIIQEVYIANSVSEF